MPKMSDTALKALLQAERNASLGGSLNSDLSTERATALEYYDGEINDMPHAEGRSGAVSSDVADTIEGLMPPLIEICASGDEVVRFDPVEAEDEEAAQQETDYVNHVFMQKNRGFLVLFTFIKDALLSKNSIVKVYWDKTEREERETYHDVDDATFAIMASAPDAEIIEHTKNTGEDGAVTHDVTLVKRKTYGCARAMPVPPEEFGISKNARTIEDATYAFHEVRKTESDLIGQGYDEAQIKSLPTAGLADKEEETARNFLNEDTAATETMNKASRLIETIEHYVFMDYEDNGKPSLYKVTTGGKQLVVLTRDGKPDVESVDVIPFASMTPIIVPHRFFGKSIADLVMDIMRIKTALIRALLDNVYLMNNQRLEVAETMAHERTLDDLLVNRPGAIVRVKQSGAIQPIPNQPIGTSLYPAIEYFDATREWRTGVTRQGQGIDANALQNQSATAVNQAFTAAQARMKLIARIFAETGIRDLFALMHGCIRKNDKQANTVRLRNKWVTVDPRNWKTRDDMTINVGLGDGGKAEQFVKMMKIAEIQKEMLLGGKSNIVDDQKLYNSAAELTKFAGHKKPDEFFNNPDEKNPDGSPKYPPPPPQQDPKVMQIQMQAQLDEKADQRKAQIEQVQAQADIATNQQKIQSETVQSQQEFAFKKELAVLEFQLQAQLKREEMDMKREAHQQTLAQQAEQHRQQMESGAFKAVQGQETHEQKMKQMTVSVGAE